MSKLNVLTTDFTDIKAGEVSTGAMLCVNAYMQFEFLMSQGIAMVMPNHSALVFMLMNSEHNAVLSGVLVVKTSGDCSTDCRTVVNAFVDLLDDKLTDIFIAVPTYGHSETKSVEGASLTILAPYTFSYLDASNYYEGSFETKATVDFGAADEGQDASVLAYDLEYTREVLSESEIVEDCLPFPIDNLCSSFKVSLDSFIFNKSVEDIRADLAKKASLVDSPDTLQ